MKYFLVIYCVCLFIDMNFVECTNFLVYDDEFVKNIRRTAIDFLNRFQDLDQRKLYGKFQTIIPINVPFFCDTENEVGRRSSTRPTSINYVRPADIDVIACMGDSLSVGHGIASVNLLDIGVENRGMSWSGGGQETWRTYTTLPNIMKVFNPNLYGYASKTSLSMDRASRFNVAEGAAISHDMLYQARVLKIRLENDRHVNMANDWKMVTLFFGALDICVFICSDRTPIIDYEMNLVKVLRFFRDNIPRIFVNIIAMPNPRQIVANKKPPLCHLAHSFACSCFNDFKTQENMDKIDRLVIDWQDKTKEVINRAEFDTEDFTVNYQPFTTNIRLPLLKNKMLDLRYFAADCFHFSQKFQSIISKNMWNNLLEPNDQKSNNLIFEVKPKCPTNERPFLATRQNSQDKL